MHARIAAGDCYVALNSKSETSVGASLHCCICPRAARWDRARVVIDGTERAKAWCAKGVEREGKDCQSRFFTLGSEGQLRSGLRDWKQS